MYTRHGHLTRICDSKPELKQSRRGVRGVSPLGAQAGTTGWATRTARDVPAAYLSFFAIARWPDITDP